jgi:hypothetical protein
MMRKTSAMIMMVDIDISTMTLPPYHRFDPRFPRPLQSQIALSCSSVQTAIRLHIYSIPHPIEEVKGGNLKILKIPWVQ